MKKTKAQKVGIVLFVLSAFVLMLRASYPGFMSPDSLDQYAQAKSHLYTDWHPPFMAWFWHCLLWIKDGPQVLIWLFNLLYWSGVLLLALQSRPFVLSIVVLLLSCAPPLINFLGVVWKDTFLFSLLFFQFSLLFFLFDKRLTKFTSNVLLLVAVLCSYAAVLLRYNAAPAVFPLLIAAFYFYSSRPHILRSAIRASVTCLVLLVFTWAFNKRLPEAHQYPQQQLMTYDLMGISYARQESLMPVYLQDRLPISAINTAYNDYDGGGAAIFDLQCTTSDVRKLDSLKRSWWRASIHHPKALLKHKYRAFKRLQMDPTLLTYHDIRNNQLGLQLTDNSFRDVLVSYLESPFAYHTYKGIWYLLICGLVFIYASLSYRTAPKPILLLGILISMSGLLYSLFYFPLSPSTDFRYHYWSIGASFLSIVLVLQSFVGFEGRFFRRK